MNYNINDYLDTSYIEREERRDNVQKCQMHPTSKHYIDGRCETCIKNKGKLQMINAALTSNKKLVNVPNFFINCTFDNFIISNDNQLDIVNKLKMYDYKENIIFFGKPGVGKTHLACALIHKILFDLDNFDSFYIHDNRDINVRYIRHNKLVDYKINDYKTYDKYINYKFLVIDEVFSHVSDLQTNVLYDVFEHRYAEDKPTFLITNLTKDIFKSYISDSFKSKLSHNSIFLTSDSEDYRTKDK